MKNLGELDWSKQAPGTSGPSQRGPTTMEPLPRMVWQQGRHKDHQIKGSAAKPSIQLFLPIKSAAIHALCFISNSYKQQLLGLVEILENLSNNCRKNVFSQATQN